jgi:hypothetical protein
MMDERRLEDAKTSAKFGSADEIWEEGGTFVLPTKQFFE